MSSSSAAAPPSARLLTISRGEADTRRFAAGLLPRLLPDGVLLLSGDLGAGKTVLTQGLAAALGIPPEEVQSPTYTLIREHTAPDGTRLVHADLYRLEPEEAVEVGLEELLAGPGVKVIEWAERWPWPVAGALHLELRRTPEGRAIRERAAPGS